MPNTDSPPVLNVYVGCEPPQVLAAKVLEHSILLHTRGPVKVLRLNECVANTPLDLSGRTMFSLQRYFIPELNRYQGQAVYVDSDMLVFGDVWDLTRLRNPDVAVSSAQAPPGSGRRPQFSVMLIDCERARWNPADIQRQAREDYRAVMYELVFESSKSACLPYQWNSLERYEKDTCLLHFTDMNIQPWVSSKNPLGPIWMDGLLAAIRDGFVKVDEVAQAEKNRWLRPGLLWQVENGERDAARRPVRYKLAELVYTPPHKPGFLVRRKQQLLRAPASLGRRISRLMGQHRAG